MRSLEVTGSSRFFERGSQTLLPPILDPSPARGQGREDSRRRGSKRRAFSLFEVVIALAIFAFSLAAIGQLISSGVRGAVHSRLQTEAMFLCESKLAEVVSGVAPLQAVRETPFPDDRTWNYSIEMQAGPQPDLYVVRVTVKHLSTSSAGSLEYSLSRVVRDPDAILLMEQEKAQLLQQYQQQQSTSGTTSSTGSSGSSGGGR